MAYLSKADLETHIYGENINEITRGNDGLVTDAIDAAIAEASAFLNKYNLNLLFGDPATPNDKNLKNKVKDLACWHLVKLANPNIDIEVFEKSYEFAIKNFFQSIMKGQMDPQGWPYKENDPATDANEGGSVTWNSNHKRRNNF